MADFDVYDYLEATIEGEAGRQANGEAPRSPDKEERGSKRQYEDEEDPYYSKRIREEAERPSSKGKDRLRERGPERERERERERDRVPRERERPVSHGHNRDRGSEWERSRDRVRGRDQDGRDRERTRERYDRERNTERPRNRRHEKGEEDAEPVVDPERDQRTVFAYQIPLRADERDVFEFFSRAGMVRDVRLIVDRNSRRHKGVGYIEFDDVMSVPMAIALSGQTIKNCPVMVKPSEAEKNLLQPTPAASTATGVAAFGARRLYVGNLHFNMTEEQLKQVFEPFGPLEAVQLPLDPETSTCKGFGFVQYLRLEDAKAAQQNLNGLELAGRAIKVAPVSENSVDQFNVGEIDDDEGGGLSLNARSRALLMQKLDRGNTGTAVSVPVASPLAPALAAIPLVVGAAGLMAAPGLGVLGPGIEPVGLPAENLILRNMFDPTTETDPEFDLDIKDDVTEECSKFGIVKHIYVDKNSAGHVYLKFENVAQASGAQRALHGRWFAGKMITASFIPTNIYAAKFPDAPA